MTTTKLAPLKHITPADESTLAQELPPGQDYVNWVAQEAQYADGTPKWNKYPLQPLNTPADHLTLDVAFNIAQTHKQGLGIVMTQAHSLIAIDVDHVALEDNPLLARLLRDHPTRIEASPSGQKKNCYRVLYNLVNPGQKSELKPRPTVWQQAKTETQEKQEIQVFSHSGYVTYTAVPIEEHPHYNKEIAEIDVAELTALWPKAKERPRGAKNTENAENTENPSLASSQVPQSGAPEVSSLFQSVLTPAPAPHTDPEIWIAHVQLDPSLVEVQTILERQNWNHYEYWLTGLMAIKSAFGELKGINIAHQWSATNDPDNYDEQAFLETWKSLETAVEERALLVSGRTYEAFYKWFVPEWPNTNKAGIPLPDDFENFEFWLSHTGLSVQVDPVNQAVFLDGPHAVLYPTYYADKTHHDSSPNDDFIRISAVIHSQCRRMKLRPKIAQVREHLTTMIDIKSHKDKINRFARLIDQEDWDGEDHLAILARDILHRNEDFEHPTQEFHGLLIKKWFMSLARSFWPDALSPRHRNQAAEGMLIVSSRKGGIGKSDFPNYVVPPEWQHLHLEVTPQLDSKYEDKDFLGKICTRLIANFDEVDKVLTGRSNAKLKAYVTAQNDVFRPPYAKSIRTFPRLHSTYSSTNKEDLKLSRDGARRWWWLNIDYIDIPAIQDYPVMQIWAQVKHLLIKNSNEHPNEKAPWLLTPSELKYLESYIAIHTSTNSLVSVLQDKFIMTKEAYQDKLQRVVSENMTNSEATMSLSQLAETLGVPANKNLSNTIKEELAKLAPETHRVGRGVFKNGCKVISGQWRYLMPEQRNEF